jgi:hypothetical protein
MKKALSLFLVLCLLFGVCSCRRKKPSPTSAASGESEETEQLPDLSEVEIPGTSDTNSYRETTVPSASVGQTTPHKRYSCEEISAMLYDLADIHTGDLNSAFVQKYWNYYGMDYSVLIEYSVTTPGARPPVPGGPDIPFQITDGSYIKFVMVIYDYDVVEDLYKEISDYYQQVFGKTMTSNPSYEYNGELIMYVCGDPDSSVWGDSCYMAVEKYDQQGLGYDSSYVTVCMPILK